MDDELIDYEMDSEEEMEELNGEEINSENEKEEEDEDMTNQDEGSFIVSDGYVSQENSKLEDGKDIRNIGQSKPKRTFRTIIKPKVTMLP